MPKVRWLKTVPGEPRLLSSVSADAIVSGEVSEVSERDAERAIAARLAEPVDETKAAGAGKRAARVAAEKVD